MEFSQQLSTATSLEVTNRYFTFGKTITGADVSNLAKAVPPAKRILTGSNYDCDWEVKFRAGTNYLAAIHLNRDVIMIEGVQYRDGSGVVMALWQKLAAESAR